MPGHDASSVTRISAAVHRLRGIYAIVGEEGPDPVDLTRSLLAGGIRIVQYRAKSCMNAGHAHAIRAMTLEYEALFILNDDWRAVDQFDADGVHLGPADAQIAELRSIRKQLRGRVIGLSCGTPDEARAARGLGADYLGVGSVFTTRSKPDAGEPIGISGLQEIAAATSLPVAAIGGITERNLAEVAATGVQMAALISAFARSPDAAVTARELVKGWPA